jgi:hypothetical protein
MKCPFLPAGEPVYEVLLEDADGRQLRLGSAAGLEAARALLGSLATSYPGMRLILREQQTRAVLASTAVF